MDDLEESFRQNFDSEEKVESLTRVIKDFNVLRELSEKMRSGQLEPPNGLIIQLMN